METEKPKVVSLREGPSKSTAQEMVNYFQTIGPLQGGSLPPGPKHPFQFGQITYYGEVIAVDSHQEVTIKVKNSRHLKPGDKVIVNQSVEE